MAGGPNGRPAQVGPLYRCCCLAGLVGLAWIHLEEPQERMFDIVLIRLLKGVARTDFRVVFSSFGLTLIDVLSCDFFLPKLCSRAFGGLHPLSKQNQKSVRVMIASHSWPLHSNIQMTSNDRILLLSLEEAQTTLRRNHCFQSVCMRVRLAIYPSSQRPSILYLFKCEAPCWKPSSAGTTRTGGKPQPASVYSMWDLCVSASCAGECSRLKTL